MSNRLGLSEVIVSALFFLIATFTLCVVVLTFTFNDFSGLFLLVSGQSGVYGIFYLMMGLLGISSLILIVLKERSYQRMQARFFVFCYSAMMVFVANALVGVNVIFSSGDAQAMDSLLFSFFNGSIVDGVLFFLFIALPFLYYVSIQEVPLSKKFYVYPHLFVPSPNIMMVILFGFAIQPLNKDYWWQWWEIALVLLGAMMISYLYYKQKFLFASYERFNFILLLAGVVAFIVSHSVFEGYASQYAAKRAIYLLALVGWVWGVVERYKIAFNKKHF